MKLNGVILSKLQALDEVLGELRSLVPLQHEQLREDWRTRRAVERDLQILVEIVIDVCQRLLSLTDQTPACTGADAISRCVQLGALADHPAYSEMVQLRSFIVHQYGRVDDQILVDMVNQHLEDFSRFRTDVMTYVQR